MIWKFAHRGQQFTTSTVELLNVAVLWQALVHPTGQIPGEYTTDVSEKGNAGGKQLAVTAPRFRNHCVPERSFVSGYTTHGVCQQSAGAVKVVVSGKYVVVIVAITNSDWKCLLKPKLDSGERMYHSPYATWAFFPFKNSCAILKVQPGPHLLLASYSSTASTFR
ncbi:hypothetical protein BU23DRAFT_295202 [Bimuria novae-zelandiae CBS 107.79]|uniref:Uncharacterized protein n=1 Tax=Bimuria novae-zelandiae CBS 107.79 TaxID=1447943 RepID=A0A6A5VL09_9PLEO|nr:hypothetical protein BU23DRAFT_295202 [Bimuria novae-zelandiae CBS 107.79]